MALRPELMNSFHDAHGGVVMALADVALAVAAITRDGAARGAITVDLSVSFLGPGKGTLRAEARCLRAGRSLAFSEGEILDADGSLVAKAIGHLQAAPLTSLPPRSSGTTVRWSFRAAHSTSRSRPRSRIIRPTRLAERQAIASVPSWSMRAASAVSESSQPGALRVKWETRWPAP